MLSGEAADATIYPTRCEHANHYTTNAIPINNDVQFIIKIQVLTQKCAVQKASVDVNILYY